MFLGIASAKFDLCGACIGEAPQQSSNFSFRKCSKIHVLQKFQSPPCILSRDGRERCSMFEKQCSMFDILFDSCFVRDFLRHVLFNVGCFVRCFVRCCVRCFVLWVFFVTTVLFDVQYDGQIVMFGVVFGYDVLFDVVFGHYISLPWICSCLGPQMFCCVRCCVRLHLASFCFVRCDVRFFCFVRCFVREKLLCSPFCSYACVLFGVSFTFTRVVQRPHSYFDATRSEQGGLV
jgi:hypothetical protein